MAYNFQKQIDFLLEHAFNYMQKFHRPKCKFTPYRRIFSMVRPDVLQRVSAGEWG